MAKGTPVITGDHQGHTICPHDHHAQNSDRNPWCAGRWLCLTCASTGLPHGVWFTGPVCPRKAA